MQITNADGYWQTAKGSSRSTGRIRNGMCHIDVTVCILKDQNCVIQIIVIQIQIKFYLPRCLGMGIQRRDLI